MRRETLIIVTPHVWTLRMAENCNCATHKGSDSMALKKFTQQAAWIFKKLSVPKGVAFAGDFQSVFRAELLTQKTKSCLQNVKKKLSIILIKIYSNCVCSTSINFINDIGISVSCFLFQGCKISIPVWLINQKGLMTNGKD